MEIFRFNILPDEEFTKREIFKQSLLNCQLCGSELQFEHKIESQQVHEEGHCPSCRIRMKKQTHNLH